MCASFSIILTCVKRFFPRDGPKLQCRGLKVSVRPLPIGTQGSICHSSNKYSCWSIRYYLSAHKFDKEITRLELKMKKCWYFSLCIVNFPGFPPCEMYDVDWLIQIFKYLLTGYWRQIRPTLFSVKTHKTPSLWSIIYWQPFEIKARANDFISETL